MTLLHRWRQNCCAERRSAQFPREKSTAPLARRTIRPIATGCLETAPAQRQHVHRRGLRRRWSRQSPLSIHTHMTVRLNPDRQVRLLLLFFSLSLSLLSPLSPFSPLSDGPLDSRQRGKAISVGPGHRNTASIGGFRFGSSKAAHLRTAEELELETLAAQVCNLSPCPPARPPARARRPPLLPLCLTWPWLLSTHG